MLLEKLGTAFLLPVGFSILALLAGVALRRWWPRASMTLLLFAALWLWLWSTPWAADRIGVSLEQRYPAYPAAQMPLADAIVILGGGLGAPVAPWRPDINLSRTADRVFYGAALYRNGRAPAIVVTGGRQPWSEGRQTEAETMRDLLVQLGVPPEAVVLEDRSRTTRENAAFTQPVLEALGMRRILLVTSAQHMPRSMMLFRGVAEVVIAAPTDVEAVPRPLTLWSILPNSDALDLSSRAIKEYLGMLHHAVFVD
jgi:uncharacterized SAM-binding protein YcdF (DUF218 family)